MISYPRLQSEDDINNSKLESEAPIITREDLSPRSIYEELDKTAGIKLDELIQDCKAQFRDKRFIITCNGYSETIETPECAEFFSRFGKTNWLSSHNLMPLMYSIDWPSTTLLLHSSFMTLDNKLRWPVDRNHDRLVLPCGVSGHWTLFIVDLRQNRIDHFDSLPSNEARKATMIANIQRRLADAMEGEYKQFSVQDIVRACRTAGSFSTDIILRSAKDNPILAIVEYSWFTTPIVSHRIKTQ